jgi:hypothetical protein
MPGGWVRVVGLENPKTRLVAPSGPQQEPTSTHTPDASQRRAHPGKNDSNQARPQRPQEACPPRSTAVRHRPHHNRQLNPRVNRSAGPSLPRPVAVPSVQRRPIRPRNHTNTNQVPNRKGARIRGDGPQPPGRRGPHQKTPTLPPTDRPYAANRQPAKAPSQGATAIAGTAGPPFIPSSHHDI